VWIKGAIGVLLLPFCCSCAVAGPWLREEGTGFAATSSSLTYFLDTNQSLYLEYGLRADLTLAADIQRNRDAYGLGGGVGTFLLRLPFVTASETHLWAYELGIGAHWTMQETRPHLRAGLSWGRSIEWQGKHGWTTIDAALRWAAQGDSVIKIDGSLGLNFDDRSSAMVQLFLRHDANGTAAKLAPSYIFSVGEKGTRFQLGLEVPIKEPSQTAAKIGIWYSF
jgi:hypothetical protein